MGTAIDELRRRNERYSATFEAHGLQASPELPVAVVTCMDARIETGTVLGLAPGDAHIIRNAGGIVNDDVIRSLCISQGALGTREVMIVMHTDCGLGSLSESALRDRIAAVADAAPDFPLGAFTDVESAVRASMLRVRACPVLAGRNHVRGFVYDVDRGSLREVAG